MIVYRIIQQTAQLHGRREVASGTRSTSLTVDRCARQRWMNAIPCAMLKLQPLHLSPVPGYAQHLLRLHNSGLEVPSVTQWDANPSACRTEQRCQHCSTTFVDRLSEPCASAQEHTQQCQGSTRPWEIAGLHECIRYYRSLPFACSAFPLAAVDEVAPANIRYRLAGVARLQARYVGSPHAVCLIGIN